MNLINLETKNKFTPDEAKLLCMKDDLGYYRANHAFARIYVKMKGYWAPNHGYSMAHLQPLTTQRFYKSFALNDPQGFKEFCDYLPVAFGEMKNELSKNKVGTKRSRAQKSARFLQH